MSSTALLQDRQLAEFLAVGIAVADADGRQVYVNSHFAAMLGWEQSELVGATAPYAYWPASELERIADAFARTIRGEAPAGGFELRFQRRDGTLVDVLVNVVRATGDAGQPLYVASVTDITEQRAARDRYRVQEQRLSLALNAGRLGAWEWDMTAQKVTWSPMLERIHGIDVGSFDGTFESYQADIHPEDRAHVLDAIGRSAAGEADHHLQYRIIWPDGSIHWLEAWGQLIRDDDGNPARMVGVCSDATERVLAEQRLHDALHASEHTSQEIRQILEALGEPFIVYTHDFRIRYLNGAAAASMERAGGGPADKLLGRSLWEIYPDIVDSPFAAHLKRCAQERVNIVFEEYRASTGQWAEAHATPLPDGGISVLWKATTARKRAEEALHALAETSRILAESLDWETTLAAVAHAVVPRLADWCAVTVVEAGGELRQVAVAHSDPERVRLARELNQRYPTAPDAERGVARVIRSGEPELIAEITEEMIAAGARDAEHADVIRQLGLRSALTVPLTVGGRTFGALALVAAEKTRHYSTDDLPLAMEIARRAALAVDHARLYLASEQARVQLAEQAVELTIQASQLERARRAAEAANQAKSSFLATMSHELRTPLNAIMGYTQLLQMGVPEPLPQASLSQLERIGSASRHLLSVIDEILTFSRIEAGHEVVRLEPVDLAELADEVAAVIEPLAAAKQLAFRSVLPARPRSVRTDPRKLRQILVNLLGNAVKFTEAGQIHFEVAVQNGTMTLTVRDSGIGIPAEQIELIFEAFKQGDHGAAHHPHGSGLGLAVSRRLARLLGGDIFVQSEPGAGSEFRVVLPVEVQEIDAAILA